jgi:activator of HSP90 ATPase
MNEKAEKQAQEKLNKWLKEMGAEVEDGDKNVKVSNCDSGACDISKGGK